MREFNRVLIAGLILVSHSLFSVNAEEFSSIQLKSGESLEIISAEAEGDFLKVILRQGSLKLPKSALSEESIEMYFLDTPTLGPSAMGEIGKEEGQTEGGLPVRLPDLPVLDKTPKFQVEKVSFEVKSRMPNNDKVTIQALVPKDKKGKIPLTASTIIFYAPYMYYAGLHNKREDLDSRIYWELCEVYGMTVFTAEFKTKVEDVDDFKKCYYYPESGSYEVVFEARDTLIREQGLTAKKMFIIGNSGGSSMAQRLGLLYPERIAAVAMFGGGRFGPVEKQVDIPWLILNTRGDPRAPQNVELVKQLRAQGMNALYAETETVAKTKADFVNQGDHNFHHSASDFGFELLQQFILEVRKTQQLVTKKEPSFSASIDSPFHILQNEKPNQPDRMYFPTEHFAALWRNVPYRSLEINDPQNPKLKISVLIRYPRGDVKKWVLLSRGTESDPIADGDELDKLALDGCAAITLSFAKNERRALAQAGALIEWFCKNFGDKVQKITLLGMGSGGRHLALVSATQNFNQLQHELIVADSELYWPFKDLNAIEYAQKIKANKMFLVSERFKMDYAAFLAEARRTPTSLMVDEKQTLNSVINAP